MPLTNGPLCHILKNRMYLGEINHRDASYKSDHPPIINLATFEGVQAKLIENLSRRDLRKGRSNALLTGRIFDDRGNLMGPAHTTKKGIRYRYYVSASVVQGRKAEAGSITRVPAKEVETIILNAISDRLDIDGQTSHEVLGAIKLRVDVRDQALHLSLA